MQQALRTFALLAVSSSLPLAAAAQELSVKPGLWASATTATINGNRTPTLLDVPGAITPAQKQAATAALARLGLPAGSNVSLYCQRTAVYRLPAPDGAEGCSTQVTPTNATSGTVTMSCKGRFTGTGRGSYEVVDRSSATQKFSVDATAQGMPVKLESTTVFKWLGSDCSKQPNGLEADLFPVEEAETPQR